MKAGMSAGSRRRRSWRAGCSARSLHGVREQVGGGAVAGAVDDAGDLDELLKGGEGAVAETGGSYLGEDVGLGMGAAVAHVVEELAVVGREGVGGVGAGDTFVADAVAHGAVVTLVGAGGRAGGAALAELLAQAVLLLAGDAEQLGDDEEGVERGELRNELDRALGGEVVCHLDGHLPQARFDLLLAGGGEEAVGDGAEVGVAGRVGGEDGDEAEGGLLAPRLQLATDIGLAEGAALGPLGENVDGPGAVGGNGGREVVSALRDLEEVGVAGHDEDAVVRLTHDGAALARRFVEGVGVGEHLRIGVEEAGAVEVGEGATGCGHAPILAVLAI